MHIVLHKLIFLRIYVSVYVLQTKSKTIITSLFILILKSWTSTMYIKKADIYANLNFNLLHLHNIDFEISASIKEVIY